jgi:hypothetical protein
VSPFCLILFFSKIYPDLFYSGWILSRYRTIFLPSGKRRLTHHTQRKVTKMKLTIDNSAFVRSHGKQPTGTGCWAFEIHDDSSRKVVRVVFCPGPHTLTAAKKWLKTWVAKNMAAELATGYLSASVAP